LINLIWVIPLGVLCLVLSWVFFRVASDDDDEDRGKGGRQARKGRIMGGFDVGQYEMAINALINAGVHLVHIIERDYGETDQTIAWHKTVAAASYLLDGKERKEE